MVTHEAEVVLADAMTIRRRLLAKSTLLPSGCVIWGGEITKEGYGRIRIAGERFGAHRVAIILDGREIPPGMEGDHRCHVRSCIEPSHLRVATRKKNAENLSLARNNTSGYRGVTWSKQKQRWQATVKHNNRTYSAGRHKTVEAAARAAEAKRRELYAD